MVAPTPPTTKPQSMLSYAERAKKAQGIKSSIEVLPPPTRFAQSHSPPPPPPPQSYPSTSTSAASSAPISSSATSVDGNLNQAARSASPVAPVSPVVASNESTTTPSTGPAVSSPDPAVKHASNTLDPAPSAPPKPQANFWNQRIEKMAAARATSAVQKPNQPQPPHPIATPAAGITPSPSQASTSVIPISKPSPSVPPPNGVSAGKSKKNNAASSVEKDRDDPFTVKVPPYQRKSSPKASPNLPDPNDWPEVGKSLQASSSSASQLNHSDVQSPNGVVTTPKKTERKWIPVPKEELQASVDAASRGSRSQSRSKTTRQTLHPSASTSNANISSRPQTGHTSVGQSASHSRVQSRSGSLQSSPKVPRGRRLTPDEPASNSSIPRTPDPTSSARLSPLLVEENASVPNIPSSASNSAVNSHRASPSLAHHHAILPIQASHSQPLPTHLSHRSAPFHPTAPIFYPQRSGHNSPHSLPHSQPMSPSSMFPPLPPQGPYSPYPMFNPYEYPAAGPSFGAAQYMPWPAHARNQPLSGSHSPAYPPAHMHHLPPHPLAHLPTHQQPQHQFGGLGINDLQSRLPPNGISPMRTPPVANDVSTSGQIPSSPSMDGVKEKMVFGSIQPSLPSSSASSDVKPQEAGGASRGDVYQGNEEEKGSLDRGFASFAIGIDSSETVPPRLRSRTREGGVCSPGGAPSGAAPVEAPSQITPSVSTSSDVKWKFGTASSTPPDQGGASLPRVDDAAFEEKDEGIQQQTGQATLLQTSVTMPIMPVAVSAMSGHDLRGSTSFVGAPSHLSLYTQTHPSNYTSPSPSTRSPQPPPAHSRHASQSILELPTSSISPPMPTPSSPDPDLEVRNFGYGFGRDENVYPEHMGNGEEIDEAQMAVQNGDTEVNGNGSSERGQDYSHQRGSDYHYGRGRRSEFSRGRGYGGERGGSYGGGRRARGINGFSRGYSGRGGYGAPRGSGHSSSRTVVPPSGFGGTPPSHFQPLPLDGSATPPGMPAPHPYYLPPQPPYARHGQYMPSGLEAYPVPPQMGHSSSMGLGDVVSPQPPPGVLLSVSGATQRPPQPPHLKPPVPVPMSTISFPLDSTRYYLLGQLEYYLSPQNMAQDFYLRQNMDERGWIPIPLIASFNRVTQLTVDVQLVKDVLTLSSIVQVRGSMVRMGGWEQFVLPDAQPSQVEDQPLPYPYQTLTPYYDGMGGLAGMPGNGIEGYPSGYRHMPSAGELTGFSSTSGGILKMAGGGGGENEDEDDEVEFVMGEVGTWSGASPDRRS